MYLFKVWTGGMSFHGGLLGVITAMFWYARRQQRTFLVLLILSPL
ncbi:prolipoprotein diacylglyceryl transferase family protein [Vibrio metschnikovii]